MGQCCAKEEDKLPQINIKDVCNDNKCSCMSKCCISTPKHKHKHHSNHSIREPNQHH